MTTPPIFDPNDIQAAVFAARHMRRQAIQSYITRAIATVRSLFTRPAKIPACYQPTAADRWFADGRNLFGRDDH